MGWRLPLVFGALLVAACSSELEVGTSASLVGSTPASDVPAVVALVDLSRSGLCTGALIGPRVVLTAKHCIQPPDAEGPNPPEDFRVVIGERVEEPEQTFGVTSVATTPGAWGLNAAGGTTGALIGVDVAVIELDGDPGIAPLPFRRDRVRGIVSMELDTYGYGATPEGGNAERRQATTRVDSMTSQFILTDAVVCSGDSGGPLIHPDGDIVGVASLGPSTCGDGPGVFNTLHLFLDLIDAALATPSDAGVDSAADAAPVDGGEDASEAGIDSGEAGIPDAARDATRDADLTVRGGGGCSTAEGAPQPIALMIVVSIALRRRLSGRRDRS
jgi:V8-like Glu-specific endopeptidase